MHPQLTITQNMKKFAVLIAFGVTALTFNANAQDVSAAGNKVRFGLKAGFNLANIYDQQGNNVNTDAKLGLAGGAFLNIPLGSVLGFQPEVLFSQKGFRGNGQILGTNYEFSRTTSYLEIPLLLAIKPGPAVSLLAGPHFSYLLAQRDAVSSGDYTAVQNQSFSNDNPRRNTMGFTAGADFYLNRIILAARVGWDITNNNGDGTASSPSYKNSFLQLCIGFNL
jgi:hypothetical protein